MRRAQLSRSLLACVLLGLVGLTGCVGQGGRTVDGKVVVPANYRLAETDSIEVRFVPTDAKGKGAAASCSAKDLTFSAKNVLPGKYKVAVTITPYAGMPESEKRARALEPVNESFNENQTPLNVEVGSQPQQSITIDLGTKTVTKN